MADEQATPRPSAVEGYKQASQGLSGTIAQSYAAETPSFEESDVQILKFHGVYQQDDRDLRSQLKKQGLDKKWIFMIRLKVPGGRMSAEQYLAMDRIADLGNATLRFTSRQTIQYHHVPKNNLRELFNIVNDVRMTTMGGCGDINRNVMCCAAADLDWRAGLGMQDLCAQVAERFAPHSTAHWEIWCNGKKWGEPVEPTRDEPFYGKHYMPRKYKQAVAVPEDNAVDLYTQDVGIEVVHENGRLVAYDLIVGGGMGFSHGREATFPRLGSRLVRCLPGEILEVLEAIASIQRDFGDRADRQHARMKYLIEDRGEDWFRGELFRRIGRELPPAGPMPEYGIDDQLGWRESRGGGRHVGLWVPGGRLEGRAREGVRAIVERFGCEARITPKQNLVLAGFTAEDQGTVQALLDEYGISTGADLSRMKRIAMACVALPTCGLALAESERFMPDVLDELERLGVADADVELRMTGCPNSCVRTPTAEIAAIGRGPRKYALYVGGNQAGSRLAKKVHEKVAAEQLAAVIKRLIDAWTTETKRAQAFGDWACTADDAALTALCEG